MNYLLQPKRQIFIFLLFGIYHSTVQAQHYFNSSEFDQFKSEKNAIAKYGVDSVFQFIDSWIIRSEFQKDDHAKAFVLMYGGRICQRFDKIDEALDYNKSAAELIEKYDLQGEFTFNKIFLAMAHGVKGNYEKAILLALESIPEVSQFDHYENRSNFFVLANAYLSMYNFEKMDFYLQEMYNLVKTKNNRTDIGFTIFSIFDHYDRAGMYEQASYYQQEFLDLYSSPENKQALKEHAFITIDGNSNKERIEKLLHYIPFHKQNNRVSLLSKSYRHLGLLYAEERDYKNSEVYLRKATELPEGIAIENQLDVISSLSKTLKIQGKYEEALIANEEYIDLLDSFKNQQVLYLNNELEEKYQNKQNQIEIELKESQITAKNRWLILIGIAGVILFLSSIFILFLYRKLRFVNQSLKQSVHEKETLLKEIHHRVKNNLQVISSLLSLQSRYVKDQSAIYALNEGQNRVDSMALIHQNLYREDNITGVEMQNYIPLLANNIFNSYNIHEDKIIIAYDIDEITLDVSSVIPMGLVLNELISNALKYAFVDQDSGKIKVSLKRNSNDIVLIVSDNGVGYDTNIGSTGFGSKLIKSFTRKLDGSLNIVNDNGTRVEIVIQNFKSA